MGAVAKPAEYSKDVEIEVMQHRLAFECCATQLNELRLQRDQLQSLFQFRNPKIQKTKKNIENSTKIG